MKYKSKIILQSMTCLAIVVVARGSMAIDNPKVEDFRANVTKQLLQNYTAAELKGLVEQGFTKVKAAPAMVSTAVIAANSKDEFVNPIDENSKDEIRPVYAVSGGRVLRVGYKESIGTYVSIEHPGKMSVYGNLSNLKVVSGDRVRVGQIIGSFDKTKGKDFYYELQDTVDNSEKI